MYTAPVMNDDASTAYICIYCPFNSDNLEALEHHLASAHEHGCQDASVISNVNIKANKREAPDDEKSQSPFDGAEQTTEHLSGVKRVKRTPSPSSEENSESEDDEGDSSLDPRNMLTCPLCGIPYPGLDRLIRHAKRKHHVDLANSDQINSFDLLSTSNIESKDFNEQQNEILPSSSSISESNATTTDCPYCDYKTTDIEQFKAHIIAHIRDKNYRCLLCNRLYKYRGDCSFHIRRKHHRYSANSNDYIQRFLFDTSDGDESASSQAGAHGTSSGNGSTNNLSSTREQEEPVRYFGCSYCDYTSNYGGDVRKHQARKHPNAESKVVKIIRQDSEQQNLPIGDNDEDDIHPSNKAKSMKKSDKSSSTKQQATSSPTLSNFAPVRVFQCSSCHQQGTYKWVVERHIRAKHPEQANVHVIELPAELSVKLQKITPPLKRFRCSLCPLQSKHSWVVIRHIKHFHTLQTASVLDVQPDGKLTSEESLSHQNGDLSNKVYNHESDSSSASSSSHENGIDLLPQSNLDDETNSHESSLAFTYKCSICDYQSNISWNVQKHLNEFHSDQSNAYILTQCRQTKSKKKSKDKNGFNRSLSPTSAIAKAKFSPAIEEALLSLQGSKLNPILYAVQPKFGIKRLKCRHCFYRSNWKTDMIRHVRIRHNLTEPDHNKDMILMTEQEARSTIELYENTFGKELRRRTFRTWNDWTKAEQEFNPKDGSLQYANTNNGPSSSDANSKKLASTKERKSSNYDDIKQSSESQQNVKASFFNPTSKLINDEFKQLPNPSNIVSRLLLTASPSHTTDNDAPLDLSLKSSKETFSQIDPEEQNTDDDDDEHSSVLYLCSECPYKRSNWSLVQRHLSLHSTDQGLVCPLCSYATATSHAMIRHMTIIHPTSQIPTKFSNSSSISTAHIIERHQDASGADQYDRFETHDDEEYDIDSSDNDDDIIASTTKNLFDCPICSPSSPTNLFTNLEQLTIHVITNHNNQSCPFCSYLAQTTSTQTLIQHISLHFNGALVQPDPMVGIEQVKELLMLE